ncbi:MAG TPA: response regulator transcription factor [Actinomycetes bacterium]|nr:response regulator transcription factor [Actinomycetes bacterium]
MTGRVLVVEDDHELRGVVAKGLRRAGFEVTTASDGASALRTAEGTSFDAVVLDIGLPDADGRDVCQALRAAGTTAPVVFLTARGGVTDRLSGFAAGGDDYLAKPFHLAELVARLEVAIRRTAASAEDPATGDLRVDPASHELIGPADSAPLSPTEFRLLARLLAEPRGVVRRNELVAAAWAHGSMVADNTLDQYVAKLRRKLADVGTSQTIGTVRGVGYRVS